MKVTLNLNNATDYFGGAFDGVLELARLADSKGVDQLSVGDHLALVGHGLHKYPRPTRVITAPAPDTGLTEPIATLSAFAAVTRRVGLSTNVIVAPLRPALLLAKQIATLDLISGGRAQLAWGTGWHEEEFDATGIPFEGRFGYLEEQVAVCRAVWGRSPAEHHGRRVQFTDLYSTPLPPQRDKIPIWFGMDPTPRNIERIARLADGWAASPIEVPRIADGVAAIRVAVEARGGDAAAFPVRATLPPVRTGDGNVDMAASFAQAATYRDAGVTGLSVILREYCKSTDQIEDCIDRLLDLKAL